MLKLIVVIIVLLVIWHLTLPVLFVVSLLPGLDKPPLNFVTFSPAVSTYILDERDNQIHLDVHRSRIPPRAKLIIFPAANELGKDDSRLKKLALLFARMNLRVYVPTLANLNRERFHPQVMEEMQAVIKFARDDEPKLPLQVLSFSIAVGPELIVAAREELRDELDLIISMGGYYDLANVIKFHTTNVPRPDPFGLWLFARYYAQFLPPPDARIFYEIADRKWQNPESEVTDLAKNLGPKGQQALALLLNKDPEKFDELLAALPPELKNFLDTFDPRPGIANLKSEILLLHSIHDPVIPFEESQKLLSALRENKKEAQFIELRVFDHVNPVLPPATLKNIFTLYLPEFVKLYVAVFRIVY